MNGNTSYRRKLWSQTSDNMDRWKAEVGRIREGKKKEDQRREKVRRKKMQVRQRVEKSRGIVFFPMFCGSEGRKVGPPKRRVRSHLVWWEMKNCTPLWREAHFGVQMQKYFNVGALLELEMLKRCTPLWCEAHFEIQMLKIPQRRSKPTVSKTWGFCSISKNDARRGTFEEDLQRCISRGRRSTRDMFIRDVGLDLGASDLLVC